MADHISDGIIVISLSGQIIFANALAAQWHGYTPEAMQGQPIDKLLATRTFPGEKELSQIVSERDAWHGKLLSKHRQQYWMSVDATVARRKDQSGAEQVLFLIHKATPVQRAAQLRGAMAQVINELMPVTSKFFAGVAHRTAYLLAVHGFTVIGLRYEPRDATFIWTDLVLSPVAHALLPAKALLTWRGKRSSADAFADLLVENAHFVADLPAALSQFPTMEQFLSVQATVCGQRAGAIVPVYQEGAPQLLLLFAAGAFTEPEREAFRWYYRYLNRLAGTIAQQRAEAKRLDSQTLLWQAAKLLGKEGTSFREKCALVLEHALPAIGSEAAGWLFLPDNESVARTLSRQVDAAGQVTALPGWTIALDRQLFDCLDRGHLAEEGWYERRLPETCPASLTDFFRHHGLAHIVAMAWPEAPGFLLLALPIAKPLSPEIRQFWQEIVGLLSQVWQLTASRRFLLSELKQTRAFTANALSLLAVLKRLDASPGTSTAWAEALLDFPPSYFRPDGISLWLMGEKRAHLNTRGLPEALQTTLQNENIWPTGGSAAPFLLRAIEADSPWRAFVALMDKHGYADALVVPLLQDSMVHGYVVLWLQQPVRLTPTQRAIAEHFGQYIALRWQATKWAQKWNKLRIAHDALLSQEEDGLLLFDADGNLLEANDAWYRVFGTTARQEVGKTWQDFLAEYPCSCESISSSWRLDEIWRTTEAYSLRCRLVTEKESHDMRVKVSPVMNQAGQVTHVVAIFRPEDDWLRLRHGLMAISAIEKKLLATTGRDAAFSLLLAQMKALFPQEQVHIGLVDKEAGVIRSIDPHDRPDIPLDETHSLVAHVVSTGKMVNLPDVTKSDWYLPSVFPARSELCAPIRLNDEVIGAINIESAKKHAFSIAEETLVQLVASHAANIVSLLGELQRTSAQQALYRDTLAFASTWLKQREGSERIALLLRALQKATPFSEALVAVFRKGYFEIVAERGHLFSASVIGRRLAITHLPFYNQIATTDTPFLLRHSSLPLLWDWEGSLQDQRVWCFPLRGKTDLVGFLLLTEQETQPVLAGDSLPLAFLVALLALTIENEKLRLNWQRTLKQLNDLGEMSLALTSSEDPEQILSRLLEYSKGLVHWYTASILSFREATPTVVLSTTYQNGGIVRQFLPSLVKRSRLLKEILQTRRPIIIADVRKDERWITVPSLQFVRGWLGVPILARDHVWGILMMDSEFVDFFDQRDLEVTQILANYAAVVIEHEKLLQLERGKTEQLEATQAEQTTALQIGQEMFEVVVRNMESALIILDREGTIKYANEGFTRLTGFSNEALIGKPYSSLCADGDVAEQRLLQAIRRPYQRGQSWHGQMRQRRKTGEPYLAEIIISPVLAATGETAQFIVLQRDVTAMYRAMELKDAFASTVAHELRTPLASMKLHLDLLSRVQEEKKAIYVGRLKQDINQLAMLVADLLESSRLDMDRVALHLEPVSLEELLAQSVERYQAEADKHGLALITDFPREPCLVAGDKEKLALIVSNLFTNALKYTPSGGIIRIRLVPCREKEREGCCMQLYNSGPGVPAEELPHLFDPFFRGRTAQQSSAPGTGLGLSIVKSLVELHGGTITAESQEEKGVQFNIWLPAAEKPGNK